MPVIEGVGISTETWRKIEDFRGLIAMHTTICTNKVNPQMPYLYADLTAGAGRFVPDYCQMSLFDESAGYPSLAVVAMEIVRKRFIDYRAELFEESDCRRASLQKVIGDDPFIGYHGHNADASIYLADCPPRTMGVLCLDPNGVPDFDLLARLTLIPGLAGVDIVIHYAATSGKRVRGVYARPCLLDELRKCHKGYWKVMQPRNQLQWTWLILTNWGQFPDWTRRGLYGVETPEGQEIIERLTYSAKEREGMAIDSPYKTYAEYLRHPLFRQVRQVAWRRAGYICEQCHSRQPTEVHHLRYPRWGTFDVPENLLVVCHECHCQLHGKEK